jgi:hypothetical protein
VRVSWGDYEVLMLLFLGGVERPKDRDDDHKAGAEASSVEVIATKVYFCRWREARAADKEGRRTRTRARARPATHARRNPRLGTDGVMIRWGGGALGQCLELVQS